jgi:hypothetical protein
MRIPVRDCMNEGRMTTHGWGACTSVEGTRAPSTGNAIERIRDSTRPLCEKSILGQNPVPVYFTSGSPPLYPSGLNGAPEREVYRLTPRTTVIALEENNPQKGKGAPVPSIPSNTSNERYLHPPGTSPKRFPWRINRNIVV